MKKLIVPLLVVALFCHVAGTGCSDDEVEEADEEVADKPDEKENEEKPGDEPEEEPDEEPDSPVAGETGNVYTITPDKNGRWEMNETGGSVYQPGDVIYLRGKFKSVRIAGVRGSAERPVCITNYPGETVTVGNPQWNKGSGDPQQAVRLSRCQYFVLGGQGSPSDFVIEGSTLHGAYYNLELRPFTDNAEIRNITMRNGGTGILAKTDPAKDDPQTWYPNTWLENLSIHDVVITGSMLEGMYIGNTAQWWGWDAQGNGYSAAAPDNPAHRYVRPVMWRNVKVYNCSVANTAWDGIQISASDGVEIYDNEIRNYGVEKESGQCHGILIGGRSTNTNTHDNYAHDGYGDVLQFHGSAEGNTSHVIHNNLLAHSAAANGMAIFDNASVTITNNTVVHTVGHSIRANGRNTAMTGRHTINNNVLIAAQVNANTPAKDPYIKVENGSKVAESGNVRFASVKEAEVDAGNYYQPLSGSTVGNAGYKR